MLPGGGISINAFTSVSENVHVEASTSDMAIPRISYGVLHRCPLWNLDSVSPKRCKDDQSLVAQPGPEVIAVLSKRQPVAFHPRVKPLRQARQPARQPRKAPRQADPKRGTNRACV